MKGLVKITILLLAAHAVFRFVPPSYRHHQFERELKGASQQWGEPHDEQVMQTVLGLAAKHEVPIGREQVVVRRTPGHILVDVAYEVPIEWLPSFSRPWRFTTSIDAWKLEVPMAPRR